MRDEAGIRHLPGAVGLACNYGCSVSMTPSSIGVSLPSVDVRTPAIAVGDAPTESASAANVQLDQLVAPIALYPDPLLAQLLPASTYAEQVQEAGQWLQANPNPTEDAIEAQPWSPNVKALVHYPAALQTLDKDPQWAQSLGSAFDSQPADVMAAIQDMRAQAQAAGNLTAGAQVQVIADAGVISIQPLTITAPVFVPVYDPVTVYASPVVVTWGEPYVVGPWLGYGVDWYGGAVFAGPWYGGWYHDGYWGRDHRWRYDRFHDGWRHDDRFGRSPHVDRAHFAVARRVRGHEEAFKRAWLQRAGEVDKRRAGRGRDRGRRQLVDQSHASQERKDVEPKPVPHREKKGK